MPKFEVTLPICGYAYITVEADDKAQAIAKAKEDVVEQQAEDRDLNWDYYEHAEGFVSSFPDPVYPQAEEVVDDE